MLAVIGAGYVGLATAVGLARHGFQVTLFEQDHERLDVLRRGDLPFGEPSVEGAYQEVLGQTLAVDHPSSIRPGVEFDFAFICVGTPPLPEGSLDLSYVHGVADHIAAVTEGVTPIVIRSTVPPGTAADLEARLRTRHPNVSVVANPEFLREGLALADFEHPSRRVVGGSNLKHVSALRDLYRFSEAPVVVTDATSAELIKIGANAALAVRLSMVNEIADVAMALGVDPLAVLAGIGADPRIGPDYLRPGLGFGGACLPKDLDAMRTTARAFSARSNVFDAAAQTNADAIERVTDEVEHRLDGRGAVCVAGVGFKPGSDQVRDSRPMLLVEALLERGIKVAVFDRLAEDNARRVLGDRVNYIASLEKLDGGVGLVVFTHGAPYPAPKLPAHVEAIDGLGDTLSMPSADAIEPTASLLTARERA
ncbi:MAG: nucleotide sugar dehydrogenase [Dehalococcoidia bacterium]